MVEIRVDVGATPHGARKWPTIARVVIVLVAALLVRPHAAPAATFEACGVFGIIDPVPITCPGLPAAIAAATANPGADTIQLTGGAYCPIELTGANGEITFVGGRPEVTGPGPFAFTPFEAEDSTFNSHYVPCVDQGFLVKIHDDPFTITFRDIAFEDETASGGGTAIVMNAGVVLPGSLVLRDVMVKGNSLGVSFTGFSPGRFTMSGSTITGNGTGVFITGVDVATITNSTFADNTNVAIDTGNNYSLELFNDTVTRNFIGLDARGNGNRLQLTNTIVSGNTGFDCTGADNFSLGHNVIGNTCGALGVGDQIQTFLTLAALGDNGGPTPTILPPSEAINNGANGSCQTTDQRGFARIDGACDVGAVEHDAVPPNNTPVSTNPLTLNFGFATLTFDSVGAPGNTTMTKSDTGPEIPTGFTLNGSYYEVATTAIFTTARLCIASPSVTASSRLLHFHPGPTDVTRLPVVPPEICSTSLASFSPFAIVQPVADTTPPSLSVSHAADGANGWNVTGPVAVSINASDAGSGLAATPSCTDTLNDGSPTALTVTGSSASFAASVLGEGVHGITCTVSDVAGNPASASETVKLDTKAPVVSYTGNAGTYTTTQTITITCAAADPTPGSGLVSSTCVNIAEPASNFTLGPHVLSADATDGAGNVGHGSTSFTVEAAPPVAITIGGLCLMTKQFIQTSPRYLMLSKWQKAVVDSLANAICQRLAVIAPHFTPKQKAAFVSAYKADVQALARLGWLTQAQAATLIGLANQL